MPLEITGFSPMLKVSDLAQTMKFYTQTLGITVQNRMNDDSAKPAWCALKWGATSLMFYSAESLDQPPGPSAMTGVLYFNPADVRALWEHLRGSRGSRLAAAGNALRHAGIRNFRLQRIHPELRARGVKSPAMMYSASALPGIAPLAT
jgi:uncharacterized glyoxalase superfamily protein PhnB